MNTTRKIFVGYDSREDIAWQVCRRSLMRLATVPIEVYPLRQPALRELGLYTRSEDPTSSTEFSLTRFLTGYVAAHCGWSLFVDCDFLFTRDIGELFAQLDDDKAVYVVKHDYVPASAVKMDGKVQSTYPRKNWSSLMALNGAHIDVQRLTPEVVNMATPAFLHRLNWVADEDIGALPLEWNFLVGEYAPPAALPAAIHFTNGGPWFADWRDVPFADLWHREAELISPAWSGGSHAEGA